MSLESGDPPPVLVEISVTPGTAEWSKLAAGRWREYLPYAEGGIPIGEWGGDRRPFPSRASRGGRFAGITGSAAALTQLPHPVPPPRNVVALE